MGEERSCCMMGSCFSAFVFTKSYSFGSSAVPGDAMSRDQTDGGFGVDLIQGAQNELDFLQLVYDCPNLSNRFILKNAVRRYEVFWLPLAFSKQREQENNTVLAAPLDIAWAWHVHMLAPYHYEQDCNRILSHVLHHTPLSPEQRMEGLQRAKQLWEDEFPEEPFEVDLNGLQSALTSHRSRLEYDLEEACVRQFKFYYQVSLPHYRDRRFLAKAVVRYQHYLQLVKENPGVFMVPCYDFDLIWHVHQLHPIQYKQKTTEVLGKVLHHDDTATGRTPGSKLYDSEMQTRGIWKAAGYQFDKPGAMYRGDPPDTTFPRAEWLYAALARSDYSVDVLKIEPFDLDIKKTFVIELEAPGHKHIVSQTFKGCVFLYCDYLPTTFIVDNDKKHTITLKLYHKTIFRKKLIAEKRMSLLYWLDTTPTASRDIDVDAPINEVKCTVRLSLCISSPNMRRYSFTVSHGTFYGAFQHLASVLSCPRLMVTPSDLSKASLPGEISTYRVFDWRKREIFKCRIIHSVSVILSVVEIVSLCDNVVALAHTIRPCILPERDAIDKEGSCVYLNQVEGERAILIRGQKDWGICVGKWQKADNKQKEDIDSFLSIRLFKLSGKKGWCSVRKSPGGLYVIKIDSDSLVRIDLKRSQIVMSPRAQDIPEILALGISISVLYVLCMPFSPRETQESVPYAHRSNSSKVSPMFYMAGYACSTLPTNVYIKSKLGEGVCGPCGAMAGGAVYDLDLDKSCDWTKGTVDTVGEGGWVGAEKVESEANDFEGDVGEGSLPEGGDSSVGDASGGVCFSGEGSVCGTGGGCAGSGDDGGNSVGGGDSGGGGGCGGGSSCGGDGGGCGGGDGGGCGGGD